MAKQQRRKVVVSEFGQHEINEKTKPGTIVLFSMVTIIALCFAFKIYQIYQEANYDKHKQQVQEQIQAEKAEKGKF